MKKIVFSFIFILLLVCYLVVAKYTGFNIPCIFHALTGLYCPGCGITRMFFSILEFDFYQAFRYNPLVFILLIGFIICKLFKIKLSKNALYILLFIVILYAVLRNIDIFEYLKPTDI